MTEASLWVLCVMLDRMAEVPWKACQVEPSAAKCNGDLRDWITRGYAWERRSGLAKSVLATCQPLPSAGKDRR